MDLEVHSTSKEAALSSPHLSFNFHFTGGERVLYAKDKHYNKEGLIQQGSRFDWSYYYSLPDLSVTGQIKYTDDENNPHEIDVKEGKAWVDRQWGDFTTLWWEWSCLYFDSGARVNLYSFCNDYKVGSYQKADWTTTPQRFDNFTIDRCHYIPTPAGKWLSWGWIYKFKDIDMKGSPLEIEGAREYTLKPWSRDDVHDTFYSFFEGPSDLIAVYDEHEGPSDLIAVWDKHKHKKVKRKKVGFAVTESMDILNMRNAPVAPRDKGLALYPP
jgi:hypothetical protein